MNKIISLGAVLFPVAIAAVVNFLTLPLVYRSLDKTEAGIWFLLIDITSIALALDFGISNVQIRKMSSNETNISINSQIFHGSRRALGYISLLIAVIGSLGILAYYLITDLTNSQIAISSLFFLIATSVNLYGYSLVGLLRINNRFPHIALISLFSNLTYLVFLYLLLSLDAKLIVLSIAYFVRSLISYIGFKLSAGDITQNFKIKGTFKYTKEHTVVFMNTITLYLYLAIESILLSIYYTPAIIASYIAHRKLFDFTKSGMDAYLTSTFPDMSRRSIYRDYSKLIFFIASAGFIYSILFFLSIPVMHYIAGSEYILQSDLILAIALQFIVGSGSIYVRQKNVASNLASIALLSAVIEITVKVMFSIILIPILNFKAIPLSSSLGALLSMFAGIVLSNKILPQDLARKNNSL